MRTLFPQQALRRVLPACLVSLAVLCGATPAQAAAPRATVSAATAGAAIARIAGAELRRGSTEAPRGSNAGPDVARYRAATAGAGAGSPWCAYFVSWVARAAGHPIGRAGRGVSSAAELAGWARREGRWSSRPVVGSLLVLPEHVGVVVAVGRGAVVSVDGNWSDRVTKVRRSAGEAIGYVTPPEPELTLMDPFAPGRAALAPLASVAPGDPDAGRP
jgi:hypothetical protein